jgi:hypothetical protein
MESDSIEIIISNFILIAKLLKTKMEMEAFKKEYNKQYSSYFEKYFSKFRENEAFFKLDNFLIKIIECLDIINRG